MPQSGVPREATQEKRPMERLPLPSLPQRLRQLQHIDETRRTWGESTTDAMLCFDSHGTPAYT